MKNDMRRVIRLLAIGAAMVAASASATAGWVDWSTGGAFLDNIGQNGSGNDFDKVTLTASSGAFDLSGAPQTWEINPLIFEADYTGNGSPEYDFIMTEDMTVNSITKSVDILMHIKIGNYDTLTVLGGATVRFGDVLVTVLSSPPIENYGGTQYGHVYAEFATIVPVPGAALLGLLGIAGAFGLRRTFA